jgi:hypothetical protein
VIFMTVPLGRMSLSPKAIEPVARPAVQ